MDRAALEGVRTLLETPGASSHASSRIAVRRRSGNIMSSSSRYALVMCGEDGFPPSKAYFVPDEVAEMCRQGASLYERIGYQPPWVGYLLYSSDGAVLGGGAFVGAPKDAEVEIAYFTLPEHRGKGFAKATARILL